MEGENVEEEMVRQYIDREKIIADMESYGANLRKLIANAAAPNHSPPRRPNEALMDCLNPLILEIERLQSRVAVLESSLTSTPRPP